MPPLKVYADLLRRSWSNARVARTVAGTPLGAQLGDLWRLRRNGVGPDDYYKYALFDRRRFPDAQTRATFRGYRFKDELRHFSPIQTQGIAFHKHILYRLLDDFGLPAPGIKALYCPGPDGFERHRSMTTRKELEDYLTDPAHYPLFGKPSNASHGFGALGLRARAEGDQILLVTQERATIREVADQIHAAAMQSGTYMLLELLEAREDFRKLCGSTLPSLRLVILMRNGEPEPFVATVLLPLDKQHFSNARGLTTGTLSGKVDLATGRIHRVIDSLGPEVRFVERHPSTNALVEGHVIPEWEQMLAIVMQASRAFSPFRMQHWDATFTTRGPVFLELNFIGDLEPMQIHGPPGIYTEQFASFDRTHRVW